MWPCIEHGLVKAQVASPHRLDLVPSEALAHEVAHVLPLGWQPSNPKP